MGAGTTSIALNKDTGNTTINTSSNGFHTHKFDQTIFLEQAGANGQQTEIRKQDKGTEYSSNETRSKNRLIKIWRRIL